MECLWNWCDPEYEAGTWAPTGNEIPKAGGSIGLVAILSFSSSASWSRLALARLFWNQIFTWVSVKLSELENSARSAMDRYCFCRNFLSSASSWDVLNGVRGFRLVLCFLRGHAGGLRRPEVNQTNTPTLDSSYSTDFEVYTMVLVILSVLKNFFYFKYLILKNNGYKRCFKITIFEPSSDGRRTFS